MAILFSCEILSWRRYAKRQSYIHTFVCFKFIHCRFVNHQLEAYEFSFNFRSNIIWIIRVYFKFANKIIRILFIRVVMRKLHAHILSFTLESNCRSDPRYISGVKLDSIDMKIIIVFQRKSYQVKIVWHSRILVAPNLFNNGTSMRRLSWTLSPSCISTVFYRWEWE